MMQQRLVAAGVKAGDGQLNQQGILKNTTGKPEAASCQTGCAKFICHLDKQACHGPMKVSGHLGHWPTGQGIGNQSR
jgi:hypothetical protein